MKNPLVTAIIIAAIALIVWYFYQKKQADAVKNELDLVAPIIAQTTTTTTTGSGRSGVVGVEIVNVNFLKPKSCVDTQEIQQLINQYNNMPALSINRANIENIIKHACPDALKLLE